MKHNVRASAFRGRFKTKRIESSASPGQRLARCYWRWAALPEWRFTSHRKSLSYWRITLYFNMK